MMKTTIEDIIDYLHEAQQRNAELQKTFKAGTPNWHSCETVDDKIHEALTLLGD